MHRRSCRPVSDDARTVGRIAPSCRRPFVAVQASISGTPLRAVSFPVRNAQGWWITAEPLWSPDPA